MKRIDVSMINKVVYVLLIYFSLTITVNGKEVNYVYSKSQNFKYNKNLIYKELKEVKHYHFDSICLHIEKFPFESQAHYYLQLGKLYYTELKKYNNAHIALNKSLTSFQAQNHIEGIANCYFYLGKIAGQKNDTQKFINNIDKAIEYFIQINDYDAVCGGYMTIANFLSRLENKSLAENYYQNAISYFDKLKSSSLKRSILLNTANHQYKFGNYDEAIELYKQLLNNANENNINRLAMVYNNLGVIFFRKEEWSKAEVNFKKALLYKEQIKDFSAIAYTVQNLFITAINLNKNGEAEIYFNRFVEINKEHKLPTSLQVKFNYNAIKYYALINKVDSLNQHLKTYNSLKDSLSNAAFSDKLIEMQKSFELKEKDREIALLEKEDVLNQARLKTKNILIIVIAGFLVVLLIVGYLINRQRKELVQSRRRLLRQKEDITGMNEQLRVSNLAKDRILSVIGHDLRGPVGGLKELIELYMELPEYEPNDIKNLLKAAREASTSTYHLLENLLSWANSQRGELVYNPVSAPILPLVKQTVQLLDTSINTRHIKFEFDIPEALVVQVDLNMLRTIIRNLVSNALKYSPQDSVINISAEEEGANVNFCVSDQGEGMTAEETQHIFKKKETYFIGSEMTAKGTGLGLILCKEFVERHGGAIWIDSEKDLGTKVCFSIPSKSYKKVAVAVANEVSVQ